MADSKNSRNSRLSEALTLIGCVLACGFAMACAVAYFFRAGETLWYGDAEAHLNIARRLFDSRTPGIRQIGTTWLPLPHVAMIPFVRNDELWKSGLAGAIPAGIAMALAGVFLFYATRRALGSAMAGAAAAAAFLLNPNILYLGSTPMSEPYFFAALFALLYFTVRYGCGTIATQGMGAALGAGVAACAACLTRYEGWFVLPACAIWILIRGRGFRRRISATLIFCVIAGAGPVFWLLHNRWQFGDELYFFRGPWSAAAIQGTTNYPGRGDWHTALLYFSEAARLSIGIPALALGAAGCLVALWRKAFWPVILLALPPVFYVWSMHSASTPIFVPTLSHGSFYNIRYALAVLPLAALGVGAVVKMGERFSRRYGSLIGLAVLAIAFSPLAWNPDNRPITVQESYVNSLARRAWIGGAADWLRANMGPNETFFTDAGDMAGIYRQLGVPLRDTLTLDNDVEFAMACLRPATFLHTDWAVTTSGSVIQTTVDRARRLGPRYELKQRIMVKGEPALEIYKRVDDVPVSGTEQ